MRHDYSGYILLVLHVSLSAAITPAELAFALLFNKKLTNEQIAQQFKQKTVLAHSPTAGHLIGHIDRVLDLFKKQSLGWDASYTPAPPAFDSPEVKCCLSALYQKELEENAAGRCTFVHAQLWKWEWFSWLYQQLYETTQQKTARDYQFLRFNRVKNPNKSKEDNIYFNLKNYGRTNGFRHRLFFLNAGLFANSSLLGSCSMDYWNRNSDCSGFRHNTYKVNNQYIFNKLNLAAVYDKYQTELDQLETEHQALTKRGNLLLVSLSKDLVRSHVFMASCPGYKYSVAIDGVTTDDTLKFFEVLKKNPEKIAETDCIEFCLILTKPRTLRSSDDFKIFAFNDIDPAKWAAFCKKRTALFERIKQDIEKQRK